MVSNMECNKCGTINDVDSRFCKECGSKLLTAKSLTSADHARIGELIYNAYSQRDAGNLDDAISACSEALRLNEENASAHSLLGLLYELKGDAEAALLEYGRAVQLHPADEIELLKKIDDISSSADAGSSRLRSQSLLDRLRPYIPYASAAAAFCVVLAVALALLRAPAGEPVPAAAESAKQGGLQATQPIQPSAQSRYAQEQYRPQQAQEPNIASNAANQRPSANPPRQGVPPVAVPTSAPPQPRPQEIQRPPALPTHTTPSNNSSPIVPVAEYSVPSTRPAASVSTSSSSSDDGSIVIRSTPSQPAANPEQRASQLQRDGKFQEAVSAYRESLSHTKNTGRIYQQMGICYQRLGQDDLAVDSFNRAIQSYKGQGSDAQVQRNIRACEAAIEVSKSR
jgi:Flp pilus assembly protein TadD